MVVSNSQKEQLRNRHLLIVEDDPDMLNMLQIMFEKKLNCDVCTAPSGRVALEQMKACRPDVILTDIKMPDLDGLELLTRVREYDRAISIIVMTGYGTIDMAVQAIKDGAYDFIEKPFDRDHIVRVVKNALERTDLLRINEELQQQLDRVSVPEGFVGKSPALKKTLDLIARVADTDATVLIRGESGTGKELAARALHALSSRGRRRLITVNCPALPEHILESELFGYTKGAFTGADQEKKGLFLEADHSTIILDEIGDIPISVQIKLLRVMQEKEIQPLGQNRTIKVDSRVVASTNQDLESKIENGEFREDLFYRLNVVTITMPSLEEMKEDIPLLIHHYFSLFKERYNRPDLSIPADVMHYLSERKWPGNVRELRNLVKRIVLLTAEKDIRIADIDVRETDLEKNRSQLCYADFCKFTYNDAKAEVIRQFSQEYLGNLLRKHHGNVTSAAAACGLERQSLQRLLRRFELSSADFKK